MILPNLKANSFVCPHCSVFAQQTWSTSIQCYYDDFAPNEQTTYHRDYYLDNTQIVKCKQCHKISIWISDSMVFPLTGNVEHANPDLPQEILDDYNEAKGIVNISPRGAAALLRLALQKLCIQIGEKGKNINDDIASLVKKGLPVQVQQALDSIRVIGNNAVHPGTLDIKDNNEIAIQLFRFINVICEYFISQPKRINEVFTSLPEKDIINIEKRDK